MLIIMLLEVAAIICGYIFYNKIEDRIKEMLYTDRSKNFRVQSLVNKVQNFSHQKAKLRIQCITTTKGMILGLNSGITYNHKDNVVGKFYFSTI